MSELEFIQQRISQGCRIDGRSLLDYRRINVVNSVISLASGSSQVTIGDTTILTGVKCETTNEQKVSCCIKGEEDLFLTELLTKCIEMEKYPNWTFFVDVEILSNDGNLSDAIGLSIREALKCTQVPDIEVIEDQIQISDTSSSLSVRLPWIVTFNMISSRYVVDCSVKEEECSDSLFQFVLDEDDALLAMKKDGDSGLDASILFDLMNKAKKVKESLQNSINKT